MLLKFLETEARFPETAKEVPAAAVSHVAQQVKVPTEQWAAYDYAPSSDEIREAFGFRESTEEEWLTAELCGVEMSRDRLAEAVVAPCRNDHIEPPTPAKVRRLVGKAVRDFDTRFCRTTVDRLSHATRSRLEDLVAGSEDRDETAEDQAVAGGGRSFFPADLFADVSEKQVEAWRARAAKDYPANLERMKPPMRHTEITDSLVELFIRAELARTGVAPFQAAPVRCVPGSGVRGCRQQI